MAVVSWVSWMSCHHAMGTPQESGSYLHEREPRFPANDRCQLESYVNLVMEDDTQVLLAFSEMTGQEDIFTVFHLRPQPETASSLSSSLTYRTIDVHCCFKD